MNFWKDKAVLVTGGASFIGSHLCDALVAREAHVHVVDNFSSGRMSNIAHLLDRKAITLGIGDLLDSETAAAAMADMEICFHLANRHGGRGFVDRYQADCATNFGCDSNVFRAARATKTKVVFASSGCVYPMHLQRDVTRDVRLSEDMVGPPYDADNTYGYAKLMAEFTLKAFHQHDKLPVAIGRFFTVYGERGYESHAITALIARAFIKQDPYVVWGTGEQRRNWTHVSDIVRGLLMLGEKVNDGTSVNLGTEESVRVIDAVHEILTYTKFSPRIELQPHMPTGPANRVANGSLARDYGWEPRVKFVDGLHRMIDWYFATKNVDEVRAIMERE